jgi:hypothetical protein
MASRRPQTIAKREREQAVAEKRLLKQQRKQAARDAKAAGETLPMDGVEEGSEDVDSEAPEDEPAA